MNLEELTILIQKWFIEKGLDKSDPSKQYLKVIEELEELISTEAWAYDLACDSVGDLYVTLVGLLLTLECDDIVDLTNVDPRDSKFEIDSVIRAVTKIASPLARSYTYNAIDQVKSAIITLYEYADRDFNLRNCVEAVYNIISKRTGKVVDGVFIKDIENETKTI